MVRSSMTTLLTPATPWMPPPKNHGRLRVEVLRRLDLWGTLAQHFHGMEHPGTCMDIAKVDNFDDDGQRQALNCSPPFPVPGRALVPSAIIFVSACW